jgi:hypothetical protein
LRTETTINNTYDFRIGRRLHNLPKLSQIGFAANRRLIEVERLSHDCILSEDTFRAIDGPVVAGRQRASGLRFADPRTHALLHALILFRQLAQDSMPPICASISPPCRGANPKSISPGAVTYQLRRLRLHGLIERLPNSFRHRVPDVGFRVALFFTRTYTTACCAPDWQPRSRACAPTPAPSSAPLNLLGAQIDTMIRQTQLASKT